jgi:Fe2+ or Zn2+ uptake regulation protein
MFWVVRSVEELTALFRSCGRKVTAQRQCIFGVLQGDVSHPTAESVYEAARAQMATISLKTVYQTLNELAAVGEVVALDLGTGTTRFDPNVESVHHHLVCRSCGKVRDLHADFSGVTVPTGCEEGYEVAEAEVVFRGICGECRRRGGTFRGRAARGDEALRGHRRGQVEPVAG